MLEKCISQIKPIINEMFNKEFSGHDMGHLVRTMNLALYIHEREGGDKIVIGLAAFLHDIHRIMQNESGKYVSPKDSIPRVIDILSKLDLTKEQIENICYCIEHHEDYNWNGNNVSDINTLIVQDADNLDAIGAIGIGRVFAYGGAHNRVMYDENIPLNENDDYEEGMNGDASTIHHFYHKLFKLKDNMNTVTAKKIADDRISFMKEFVIKFLDEWNSNF